MQTLPSSVLQAFKAPNATQSASSGDSVKKHSEVDAEKFDKILQREVLKPPINKKPLKKPQKQMLQKHRLILSLMLNPIMKSVPTQLQSNRPIKQSIIYLPQQKQSINLIRRFILSISLSMPPLRCLLL